MPFTKLEFAGLTPGNQESVSWVAEYLCGTLNSPLTMWDDEDFDEVFDLLEEASGCVPDAYTENLEKNIRDKFACVYYTAIRRAAADREWSPYGLTLLVDVSVEDATKIAVLHDEARTVLLDHQTKAWHFHFAGFNELAAEIDRLAELIIGEAEPVLIATRALQRLPAGDEVELPLRTEGDEPWLGQLVLNNGGHGPMLSYRASRDFNRSWDQVGVALDFFDGQLQALVWERAKEEPRTIPLLHIDDPLVLEE